MRPWIGAVIVAGAFGLISPAAQASNLKDPAGLLIGQTHAATEFSSRHRGRVHATPQVRRHKYRSGHRHRTAPPSAARSYGGHPDGMAPFFPFGFGGYGFQPSW